MGRLVLLLARAAVLRPFGASAAERLTRGQSLWMLLGVGQRSVDLQGSGSAHLSALVRLEVGTRLLTGPGALWFDWLRFAGLKRGRALPAGTAAASASLLQAAPLVTSADTKVSLISVIAEGGSNSRTGMW